MALKNPQLRLPKKAQQMPSRVERFGPCLPMLILWVMLDER
jgi:hypothetical protein